MSWPAEFGKIFRGKLWALHIMHPSSVEFYYSTRLSQQENELNDKLKLLFLICQILYRNNTIYFLHCSELVLMLTVFDKTDQ